MVHLASTSRALPLEDEAWNAAWKKNEGSKGKKLTKSKRIRACQPLQSPPSDDELDGVQSGTSPIRGCSHAEFDLQPEPRHQYHVERDSKSTRDSGRFTRLPTPPSMSEDEYPTFSFTRVTWNVSFNMSPRGIPPVPRGVKRRRHGLDISGANTAGLPIKKRRLRATLITSRLSLPFSQPATHILNREGIKTGGKRFLRISTSLDAAKRANTVHTTSFLRYALVNRLRKRLGLGRVGGVSATKASGHAGHEEEVDTANKAPKPQSLQAISGGKYIRPSGQDSLSDGSTTGEELQDRQDHTGHASKDSSSKRHHDSASMFGSSNDDEQDDELLAYQYLDDDASGDITSEEGSVYSDFSTIFRAKSPSEPQSPEEHSEYEEYLEELDGISWVR